MGVIGAKHLFDALSKFGDTDVAVKSIVGPDYPSYGYMLANGATTLWESFYKLSADGVMWRSNGQKVDSLNHHFWGSVIGWFYRVIGGLDVRSPFEVTITLPQTSAITHAELSYENQGKKINVAWQQNGTNGTLTVNNVGFVGKIVLPEGEIPLQQGDNEIAYRTKKIKE